MGIISQVMLEGREQRQEPDQRYIAVVTNGSDPEVFVTEGLNLAQKWELMGLLFEKLCEESSDSWHKSRFEKAVVDDVERRYLKRPLVEGSPVGYGEVMYGGDGRAWIVTGFEVGKHSIRACCNGEYKELKPEWLTRRRPDTQWSISNDLDMAPMAYCEKRGLPTTGDVVRHKMSDLLQRQRDLDRRELGGKR